MHFCLILPFEATEFQLPSFNPDLIFLLRLSSMMNPEFYFLFFQFCETSQNLCLLSFMNQQ